MLYYPSEWRKYVGELANDEDKKFTWFLCSKRYVDPESGYYVVEVSPGTNFYNVVTGETMALIASSKLLLLDDLSSKDRERYGEIIRKYDYRGAAEMKRCGLPEDSSKDFDPTKDETPICKEAVFMIQDRELKSSPKDGCPIIIYCKRNFERIRTKIPDFPDPEEIDDVLKESDSRLVCKVLYDYLLRFIDDRVFIVP